MLALNAWSTARSASSLLPRASLFKSPVPSASPLAKTTLVRASLSTIALPTNSLDDLLGDLHGGGNTAPPTAGASGYPTTGPAAGNPLARSATASSVAKVLERKRYRLHCQSTRNNTITTFTDNVGKTITWFSGGKCGFKKANRATYEAGYQCAVRVFEAILEKNKAEPFNLELYFKGFGQGREALRNALLASEGTAIRPLIVSITDRTPIKIGGTRAKKTRRL